LGEYGVPRSVSNLDSGFFALSVIYFDRVKGREKPIDVVVVVCNEKRNPWMRFVLPFLFSLLVFLSIQVDFFASPF
jgi:hypothetical protein